MYQLTETKMTLSLTFQLHCCNMALEKTTTHEITFHMSTKEKKITAALNLCENMSYYHALWHIKVG